MIQLEYRMNGMNTGSSESDFWGETPASSDHSRETQDLNQHDALRKRLTAMELTNRTLNQSLLAKQYEIRQLQSQIEELKRLYNDSISAKREYDKYLDTVGEVYSLACESADSIVQRAEQNARTIIANLEAKISREREEAEKSQMFVREMREGLVHSLSDLIHNLQNAYWEADSFYATLEAAPHSFYDAQQLALADIKNQSNGYYERSRAIVGGALQSQERRGFSTSGDPAKIENTAVTIPSPDITQPQYSAPQPEMVAADVAAQSRDDEASDAQSPQSEQRTRMTLLEQEKLRRKQESQALEQEGTEGSTSVAKSENSQTVEPSGEPTARDNKKRRTNVKDLLEKYKNYQLI